MEELKWKQITEFPNYYVSDGGHVINLKLRRIMATSRRYKQDYVLLSKGGQQYLRNIFTLVYTYHARGGGNAI